MKEKTCNFISVLEDGSTVRAAYASLKSAGVRKKGKTEDVFGIL